jgi:tetratricopeptide (TPR) repeat protein
MSSQKAELPRRLQDLIADAQRSLESWESEPASEPDEIFDGVKEWTARLARGEYDQHLYWECAAEDCERAGDFPRAIAAYERVVATAKDSSISRMQARFDLALLHALQRDDLGASRCCRRALVELEDDDSKIFLRLCLSRVASDDVLNGRLRAAGRKIARGLATFDGEDSDALGYAQLHIAWADCDLASGDGAAAQKSLKAAWEALEQLVDSMRPWINETGPASGVEAALAAWWTVEARRRREAGEAAEAIAAWQHAVEHCRRGGAGRDNLAWNSSLTRTLRRLADACERHDRVEEAAEARAQAEAIAAQWHLPATWGAERPAARRWWWR